MRLAQRGDRGRALAQLGEFAPGVAAGRIDHHPPLLHRHALVGEARPHHDLPASGLQPGHLLGPEVAEV